uniref:Uncharacterized protein n=1 Tax=Arundo donax TaxID=35708 RepID=A0A0A8XZG9_ARUDO
MRYKISEHKHVHLGSGHTQITIFLGESDLLI